MIISYRSIYRYIFSNFFNEKQGQTWSEEIDILGKNERKKIIGQIDIEDERRMDTEIILFYEESSIALF